MATINYWDDDWEQQVKEVTGGKQEFVEETEKTTDVECWEDDVEDQETEEIATPAVVESVWKIPYVQKVDHEYREEYPSLKPNVKANFDNEEKARVARLKNKSKINIFEAFNDDEAGLSSKPTSQPRHVKDQKEQKERPKEKQERQRAPRKSRFCRNGASCTRGDRCWWAHSERELVPEHCHRGQQCRCITVDYNKEVHMYRHDESIQSYLKRIGQLHPVITVAPHLTSQAKEMARAAGGRVKVNVR
jgi:hypothetical protein